MVMFNYETTLLEAVNELREAYAAVEEAFTNRLRDGYRLGCM